MNNTEHWRMLKRVQEELLDLMASMEPAEYDTAPLSIAYRAVVNMKLQAIKRSRIKK